MTDDPDTFRRIGDIARRTVDDMNRTRFVRALIGPPESPMPGPTADDLEAIGVVHRIARKAEVIRLDARARKDNTTAEDANEVLILTRALLRHLQREVIE